MELPPRLRQAIDEALSGISVQDLTRAGTKLSERYRAETRDGRLHISDGLVARAYIAARMPATYAAVRTAMAGIEEARPDFAPCSLLDVGAGPGTALWAAADAFETIGRAECLEASGPIRDMAERLAAGAFPFEAFFSGADVTRGLDTARPADLVTLCYVLDEISPEAGRALVTALWAKTEGMLLIVEPGTPAGWRRVLDVRQALITAGAHIVAPCAHQHDCPVAAPDWCHFARRLPRSRVHRLVKGGEAPFEDEKFIWLAAARIPNSDPRVRVLAMPRGSGGRIALKLCQTDGTLAEILVTKREGARYRAARRAMWGDAL